MNTCKEEDLCICTDEKRIEAIARTIYPVLIPIEQQDWKIQERNWERMMKLGKMVLLAHRKQCEKNG